MRKCSNCKNFYTDTFCGYNACNCRIYGSLDVDQKERHPDTAAETCKEYSEKKPIAIGYSEPFEYLDAALRRFIEEVGGGGTS